MLKSKQSMKQELGNDWGKLYSNGVYMVVQSCMAMEEVWGWAMCSFVVALERMGSYTSNKVVVTCFVGCRL